MKLKLPSYGEVTVVSVAIAVTVVAVVAYAAFSNLPNGMDVLYALGYPRAGVEDNPNSPGDTSEDLAASAGLLGWPLNVINQVFGGIPQSIGNVLAGDPWKSGGSTPP